MSACTFTRKEEGTEDGVKQRGLPHAGHDPYEAQLEALLQRLGGLCLVSYRCPQDKHRGERVPRSPDVLEGLLQRGPLRVHVSV